MGVVFLGDEYGLLNPSLFIFELVLNHLQCLYESYLFTWRERVNSLRTEAYILLSKQDRRYSEKLRLLLELHSELPHFCCQ